MAAPHFAGPHPPELDESGSGVAGPASMGDRARAAHIAELAARLAAIEGRDMSSASPPAVDRPMSAAVDRSASAAGQPAAAVDRLLAGSSERSRPGDRTTSASSGRSAPAVGSSGTAGRRRSEPGGHPEDSPGDPETVARAICLRLLTGAARPRAALETSLRQRGIPDEVTARVLDRLAEVGLIDDRAYAEAFVAAKHRDRALGVTALRTELRRKGLDDLTVDAAVSSVDGDAERERARALIERRVDSAMGHGPVAARRRLVGLLARRGYSAEITRCVVDDALAAYGAEQDEGWS